MRRKLYFVLPDVKSAQVVMNELLLARIDDSHIHFHAKSELNLGNLPRANVLEKSDVIFGVAGGMVCGAIFGILGGLLAYMTPSWFGPVTVAVIPYCMIIGAVACAAWAGVLAAGVPSHKLEPFKKDIENGSVLLITSVPLHRLTEIRNRLAKTHPEAAYRGIWPTDHVIFP
jgi:hypothetical protein